MWRVKSNVRFMIFCPDLVRRAVLSYHLYFGGNPNHFTKNFGVSRWKYWGFDTTILSYFTFEIPQNCQWNNFSSSSPISAWRWWFIWNIAFTLHHCVMLGFLIENIGDLTLVKWLGFPPKLRWYERMAQSHPKQESAET